MPRLVPLAVVGIALFCLLPVSLASKTAPAAKRRLPPPQTSRGHLITLLDPAEDSDVDLPLAMLELDGDNAKVKTIRSAKDDKPLHLTVDVSKREYHAYYLADAKKDAGRIARLYAKGGKNRTQGGNLDPESVLADKLDSALGEDRQIKAAKREYLKLLYDRRISAPQPGSGLSAPSGCGADDGSTPPPCVGVAWSEAQLWEPARFFFDVEVLAKTKVDVQWERNAITNYKTVQYLTQTCWANPLSFVLTFWLVEDCVKPPTEYYSGHTRFDAQTIGIYHNFNFGFNDHAVSVVQTVWLTNDQFNSVQSGEQAEYFNLGHGNIYESWFLSSWLWGGSNYEFCPQGSDCDVSDESLFDCEHQSDYYYWDYPQCGCILGASPLIIDMDGDGLTLTGYPTGVKFDLMNSGSAIRTGWTAQGARDGFLVLDRNQNGRVDSGAELFGNFTAQPRPKRGEEKNGFAALAVYDRNAEGGNGDGKISNTDWIYSRLQLWFDINHDGVSQDEELYGLADCGVQEISLTYKQGRYSDEFQNAYRYRSAAKIDVDPTDKHAKRRLVFDIFFAHEK